MAQMFPKLTTFGKTYQVNRDGQNGPELKIAQSCQNATRYAPDRPKFVKATQKMSNYPMYQSSLMAQCHQMGGISKIAQVCLLCFQIWAIKEL